MCKFPSGIPCSITGKVYSLLTLKNQAWLIHFTKAMNGTEPHRFFLSFCFLENWKKKKKAVEDTHFFSQQASRKSKDHKIFRCHKRPFGAHSWLYGFSIIFRGCHHSQKRRHCQLTPNQKFGLHHFRSSRTLPKFLPERRLDPPNHQGS